jgi:hypothetical protein
MRADEGYSYPSCGTREQVRDSRADHPFLPIPRSSVGHVPGFGASGSVTDHLPDVKVIIPTACVHIRLVVGRLWRAI